MSDRTTSNSPKPRRRRRALPPIDQRDWVIASEVGNMIGCSPATVHRYSNGEIAGVPRLPFLPRGVKARVFLKATVRSWMNQVQGIEAA